MIRLNEKQLKNIKKNSINRLKLNFKNKHKLNSLSFVAKIKILCFFFILCLHKYFTILLNNLITYYYKRRLEIIKRLGRHYNDSNIVTFEDKINWIGIHDVRKLKGKIADKILLREYSKRILKKDICNKILKVYDDPNKINISELPEQFVLKTNHGSGYNIIVHNKSELDVKAAKKKLSHWLKIDYGKLKGEFHYSFIKRKAFAEEYIGKYVNTYKTFCYHGVPRFMFIYKKINDSEYRTFFDMKWNRLNFNCVTPPHPTEIYPKPKNFELMKYYASKLSKPFKLARVDLYEYNNEVRLGEITFVPMNSQFLCKDEEHNKMLSKYLKLF